MEELRRDAAVGKQNTVPTGQLQFRTSVIFGPPISEGNVFNNSSFEEPLTTFGAVRVNVQPVGVIVSSCGPAK